MSRADSLSGNFPLSRHKIEFRDVLLDQLGVIDFVPTAIYRVLKLR
jgi:hypothetical protein